MSTEIRRMAKTAGVGVTALAAAMIWAPAAFADPPAPDIPDPPPDTANQAAAAPPAPAEVPHLPSPENLPPGTAPEPINGPESPRMSYLRSVWQAIQTEDLTWKDGLLMLAQRPMNPETKPEPGVTTGPQQTAPPVPAPPPAPPAPPPAP